MLTDSLAQPTVAGRMDLVSWPLKTELLTAIYDLAPAPDGGVWFTATIIRLAFDVAHGSTGGARAQLSSGLLF
ncbi:MAG: hypothetical protein ABL982_04235, partial [Vicinamibacterales bacterium]